MTLRAVTRRQGGGAHVQQVCTTPIMRSSFLFARADMETHERVHSSADMHEHTHAHTCIKIAHVHTGACAFDLYVVCIL